MKEYVLQHVQGALGRKCRIQVLGLEIDQRPGQGAIGRNV